VHIVGGICDMDGINAIAKKHGLKVIEDACELTWANGRGGRSDAWGSWLLQLSNWKGADLRRGRSDPGSRRYADGPVLLLPQPRTPARSLKAKHGEGHPILATKCRMAEYQASILITQMETVDGECRRRSENALHLTSRLEQIRESSRGRTTRE